jgi:DNA-binding transcriptional LysR family regulator
MACMQLRHLETFVAIVDAGTLTGASAQLYKTQGAVSHDLKALESAVGLELLDRSGQRVRLTAAGKALLPMARRLLMEVTDVQREMARIRAGEQPVVRLACLPSIGPTLCRLLAHYTQERPGARWSIVTTLRGSMVDGLRAGLFDLVVCDAHDEDLASLPLMREPLHIVLAHDHPLVGKGPLRPADLAGVPYVSLHRGMGTPVEAQRFFAAGAGSPAPAVEVSDTRLVLELVTMIRGFGIVPHSALSANDSVVAVDTDPRLDRQISLLRVADRTPSTATTSFATYLVERWPAPDRSDHVPAGGSGLP